LKNIIAIAAGIIDGLQLGDNTKAAMFTRGIAEISRLGVARGAEMSTFFGLAGIGDLMVTCNSVHSRNRFVGEQIGKGKKLSDILAGMKSVAEGVITTAAAYDMSKNYSVEMPITEQIHQILFEYKEPMKAMFDLMSRSSKSEVWW
jgi:glycerol-3-phosphate dehydrogenase (NAD(P)+)